MKQFVAIFQSLVHENYDVETKRDVEQVSTPAERVCGTIIFNLSLIR